MPATDPARTVRIASAIWAGSIFLSRIMGLVREQVIGHTLGAADKPTPSRASYPIFSITCWSRGAVDRLYPDVPRIS